MHNAGFDLNFLYVYHITEVAIVFLFPKIKKNTFNLILTEKLQERIKFFLELFEGKLPANLMAHCLPLNTVMFVSYKQVLSCVFILCGYI